jgi:uncharacterized protein YodC (DUF2158 family)
MAFKAGEVVVIKTTGEKVACCGYHEDGTVLVERPITHGQDVEKYVSESFYEFNLETIEQHAERQYEDYRHKMSLQDRLISEERKLEEAREEPEAADESDSVITWPKGMKPN